MRSPKATLNVLALSVALWIMIGVSFQVAALGFTGMKMGFLEGQAVNVITCLAILIPAAPGFWGLMEVGIVFSLAILAIETDPSRALAFALLVHSLQYFPILGVGLAYLWKERQRMGDGSLLITDPTRKTSAP
jgi:fatty acid desaturase